MIDGTYRFETFVVGNANRLAATAARAVASAPGSTYNPLYIYGASGLGKTHLLGAIGYQAAQAHPESGITYLTLDDFVEDLHAAVARGGADGFKRRYQGVSLLLLDDVQDLSGRPEAQSEVMRVFNALQGSGRQIVLAADRAPSDIRDVDERLLSRLAGGLLVDIAPPDYDARVELLRALGVARSASFAPGVLEEAARGNAANPRELQGLLQRLLAHQAMIGAPLTTADVWQLLGSARAPSSARADEFETFLSDITSTVARTVENWRLRLGERITHWSGQGFRTTILERAMDQAEVPDVDDLDATFATVVDRLRALEREAIQLDVSFTGIAVFRDPDCLAQAEALVARARALADPPAAPNPDWRLHGLTRCNANRVALQAVGAMLSAPAERHNPLFIHGGARAGKTHMAHAIGNALLAFGGGDWTVACVSGEALVEELLAAVRAGKLERWRQRYRAVDALVIDGIHAADARPQAQHELHQVIQSLLEAGRQVILTSPVPPSQFRQLDDGLRSRFDAGLIVEVGAPAVVDRAGRSTPVPEGAEAAAPNIDAGVDGPLSLALDAPAEPFAPFRADHGALDSFFFDSEKIIADWPEAQGRLIEELH